jgi:response regulator RpfG family c-di-GMP phosphodiesterase
MNGGRWTILVVDDVPDDIVILDEILKKEYQVKAVTNGARAALKIAQGELPPTSSFWIVICRGWMASRCAGGPSSRTPLAPRSR